MGNVGMKKGKEMQKMKRSIVEWNRKIVEVRYGVRDG